MTAGSLRAIGGGCATAMRMPDKPGDEAGGVAGQKHRELVTLQLRVERTAGFAVRCQPRQHAQKPHLPNISIALVSAGTLPTAAAASISGSKNLRNKCSCSGMLGWSPLSSLNRVRMRAFCDGGGKRLRAAAARTVRSCARWRR